MFGAHNPYESFSSVARAASLQVLTDRLLGREAFLVPFERVRRELRVSELNHSERRDAIPIGAIVGSVGRQQDFTRHFLPFKRHLADRWVRIYKALAKDETVPPIQVYALGDRYFVLDGHHRVSVAKQLGAGYIDAVIEDYGASSN